MDQRKKRKLWTIDWSKAKKIKVTQEEYARILKKISGSCIRRESNTDFHEWYSEDSYKEDEYNKYRYLFTYTQENYKQYGNVFVIYSTNTFDDMKNLVKKRDYQNIGLDSSIKLEAEFKEINGTTLCKAFGYCPENIKRCVPRQFYFTNERKLGLNEHAASIDICSHYPNSICGTLPDWHTHIEVYGTVAPTEEYPFAFYVRSGHMAIWNELDTHTWMHHKLVNVLFDIKGNYGLNPDDDITYLCKASDYRLDEVIRPMYTRKCNGDDEAKLIMNSFIGNMHTNAYRTYKMAHLAAVCIARANNRMLSIIRQIGLNNIIQACVDGVIYSGQFHVGGSTKKLGDIYEEFYDADVYIKSINAYIVRKEGKFIKAKHSGTNAWNDGRPLPVNEAELIQQIKNIEDVEKWQRKIYV